MENNYKNSEKSTLECYDGKQNHDDCELCVATGRGCQTRQKGGDACKDMRDNQVYTEILFKCRRFVCLVRR